MNTSEPESVPTGPGHERAGERVASWVTERVVADDAGRVVRIERTYRDGVEDREFAPVGSSRPWFDASKRAFDVAASGAMLIALAPVSAAIGLGIRAVAGQPVLYQNTRQTLGGRAFRCWKFRTMRRDADRVKGSITSVNTCDGPQFHVPNDPRTFPLGRALRRCHLDEIPQLISVLRGDMSIVGPRPSPDDENQCAPAWRAARLSVRAGITGLWQVRCKRRPGTDFQEWVRYDLEYLRTRSWRVDLEIMLRTAWVGVRRGVGVVIPGLRATPIDPHSEALAPGAVEPKPASTALEPASHARG